MANPIPQDPERGSIAAVDRGNADPSAASRLRVLHVLAPADFGGLERVVRALAVGQRDQGHHPRVLAVLDRGRETDHPVVLELAAAGVDVHSVALAPRAYREERRAVREMLAGFRPDVVHSHGARIDVLDSPVALRAGIPTVTTVHGFTGGGPKNRLYEYLQRRAMRRLDAVVAVSRIQREELVAAGVPAERVHLVPNAWAGGAALLPRADARRELGVDVGRPRVIGWIGRMTPEKGADVLLEAVARVREPDLHVVMVGAGPERERLEQLAARLGVAHRVRWTGAVARAERILSAFDLFVLSSRTEGTPIVLFEAMAAGVPVIVTAVGGVPDVVGAEHAFAVEPDHPEMLARAIERACADPEEARRMADAARHRLATRFAMAPWLERYRRIYESVRHAPAPTPSARAG